MIYSVGCLLFVIIVQINSVSGSDGAGNQNRIGLLSVFT